MNWRVTILCRTYKVAMQVYTVIMLQRGKTKKEVNPDFLVSPSYSIITGVSMPVGLSVSNKSIGTCIQTEALDHIYRLLQQSTRYQFTPKTSLSNMSIDDDPFGSNCHPNYIDWYMVIETYTDRGMYSYMYMHAYMSTSLSS